MKRAAALALVTLVVATLSFLCLGQTVRVSASSGTGFVVSSDGYLLTNEHVVHGATQVTVTANATEYPAAVVRTDPDSDIALLKISATGLPVVALGDSDRVAIGDTVYTIGCPRGICGTATQGRVANVNVGTENMILVDLTATHGSSGGPLFNARGEVVGITTAGLIANAEGETSGFTLAVPINRAAALLASVTMLGEATAGQTPGELDLPTLAGRLSPAVSYIEAASLRSLESFLPSSALGVSGSFKPGRQLAPPSHSISPLLGVTVMSPLDFSEYLWSWFPSDLRSSGVVIEEAVIGRWDNEDVSAVVWALDVKDSGEAGRALQVLESISPSRWGSDSEIVDLIAHREQWHAGDLRIGTAIGASCGWEEVTPITSPSTSLKFGYLKALAFFSIDDLVFSVRLTQKEQFDMAHSGSWPKATLNPDGCVSCSYEALQLIPTRTWFETVRIESLTMAEFEETLKSFLEELLRVIGNP